jgi:hypothetical protein
VTLSKVSVADDQCLGRGERYNVGHSTLLMHLNGEAKIEAARIENNEVHVSL